MNIHFTTTKKLMFDEHYNLLFDGEISDDIYKKICESLPLKENGEKPAIIIVHMGCISGNIINIIKTISCEMEKMNRQEVYIYDKSTLEDFWYCIVPYEIENNWFDYKKFEYRKIPEKWFRIL